MRRRNLIAIAGLVSSLAVLLSSPPAADAMSSCSENSDSTCQTYCPGDIIAFCNYEFRFLHCDTSSGTCENDGLCEGVIGPCCHLDGTGDCGADGRGPFPWCPDEHVTCNFY